MTFTYSPDNCKVWSNLTWENGCWLTHPLGHIYECSTDWMQANWQPRNNFFELFLKFEVRGFSGIKIRQNEQCGNITSSHLFITEDAYKISFSVNDDFVNCLDNTGDEITLDVIIVVSS